ncbi:MAG: hypothetical protein ACRDUA_26305, partial [Micromonosporaceae bacterium]
MVWRGVTSLSGVLANVVVRFAGGRQEATTVDHGSGGFRARSGCRYRARAVVVAGLVAVLACVVGCGGVFEPEPRYAATLKPCSLLPQRSVERLFEVDELAKPYTGKRFLDEWYGDVHCTWEYDLAWSELETGKLVPSERELAVELDVYDREEGGTPEADQTYDESLEKSDRTVGRIGEEAAWRYEGDPQDF